MQYQVCICHSFLNVSWRPLCSVRSDITLVGEKQRKETSLRLLYESSSSCLTYRVYNQLQSISSHHWIISHYKNLYVVNV